MLTKPSVLTASAAVAFFPPPVPFAFPRFTSFRSLCVGTGTGGGDGTLKRGLAFGMSRGGDGTLSFCRLCCMPQGAILASCRYSPKPKSSRGV
jgi:hypothetical protein